MRLDLYLYLNGYAHSRTNAKSIIESGRVRVGSQTVKKPSFDVSDDSLIFVEPSEEYVSRGAYKLKGAVSEFSITIDGRLCIDVGASSGGFTDFLLKNGAKHVIAVDSGSGQLVQSLREDGRVTVMEGFNARYMKPSDFEYIPTLAVMDVSFISATYIIPSLYEVLGKNADFICLIKPQFEVGRENIGKGGIVKSEYCRLEAVQKVVRFSEQIGFVCKGTVESSIKGGDGNVEYLAHFVKI